MRKGNGRSSRTEQVQNPSNSRKKGEQMFSLFSKKIFGKVLTTKRANAIMTTVRKTNRKKRGTVK